MTNDEFTIDSLRVVAEQTGLQLTDAELRQILPGVSRGKEMALSLRALLTNDLEPAPIFIAAAARSE